LSEAGNSVRGMKAIQSISEDLGLSLFTSRQRGVPPD
jgi:glutaminase